MEKKPNEKKVLALSFLGVLTFIAVVVGATYAYFTAQGGGTGNINVNATTNTTDNLSFQVGNAISLTANQEDFGSGMGNKSGETYARAILTANNATNIATRNYYVYLNITSNDFVYTTEDNQAEMLLKITNPEGSEVTTLDGYNYVTSGGVSGFDITTSIGLITIADNYEIVSTGTVTQEWKIEVIFVNLDSDQNENTGKSFSAELIIQKEPMTTSLGNFATYITNLYTEDGVNDLYYHDGSGTYGAQEAGDESYRYAGANPNNYVCFGSDAASCPADNLYRIIGVFGNQVKLIKNTSIGNNDWSGSSSNSSNTWSSSTLNTGTLNGTYLNGLGSTWSNLIATTSWKVGGMAWSQTNTAKQYYTTELGSSSSSTTYSAKIGLMYVSDYGYAADPSYWTTELYNYEPAKSSDWMNIGITEWTISRDSDDTSHAFIVILGTVNSSGVSNYYGYGVRPSFYLESSVEFSSGDGSQGNPYRILTGA